jgi:hypothetical protein
MRLPELSLPENVGVEILSLQVESLKQQSRAWWAVIFHVEEIRPSIAAALGG